MLCLSGFELLVGCPCLTFTITEFLQTLMHQLCQSSSVRVTNGAAVSDVFRCPSKQSLDPLLQ